MGLVDGNWKDDEQIFGTEKVHELNIKSLGGESRVAQLQADD